MRSLVIVALRATTAHADDMRRELAAALVKGDIAMLKAVADFPIGTSGLWFDTPRRRWADGGTTAAA